MNEMIDNNPFYQVFWLLVVGVAVYLAIRVIHRYVLALVKNRDYRRTIDLWDFRVRTAIWICYTGWALFHLMRVNYVITLVGLGVTLITGWRSWMESFAGMILRLERRIRVGDTIQTDDEIGTVERFNFQSLAIMTDDGQLVHIPYSKLTGDVVAQSTDQEKLMAHSFALKIDASESPHSLKERILKLVNCCPWTAVSHPPHITFDGVDTFKVTAKTIDNSVFYKLEEYVRKRLEQKAGKHE